MSEFGQTHAELSLFRLSPASRYGLQGMAYLARQAPGAWCLVSAAAEAKRLPKNFLSKIFQRLCRRGLLLARRGPGGGYALARAADRIRLNEIVDGIEPAEFTRRECHLELRPCDDGHPCALHDAILQADAILHQRLEALTLRDLAALSDPSPA